MDEVVTVLNKVLIRQYYRLNTGFFLLIITLTFGFMSGTEHRALAESFTASPPLLLLPAGVWLVYLLKIVNFNRQQIGLAHNQFLRDVTLVSRNRQCIALGFVFAGQFMPALLYGVFLMLIALRNGMIGSLVIVAGTLMLLMLAGTVMLFIHLHHFSDEVKVSFIKRFFDNRLTKPLAQFYLEWITRSEPALLFGTKIFTGLLLYAIGRLYEGETYDGRLIALGATVSFSANFMIITRLHYFENAGFSLLRNMPRSLAARASTFFLVLLILCFPEISVMFNYFPSHLPWTDACAVAVFGVSIGMVFYAAHFLNSTQRGDNSRWVFTLVMSWLFLILFSIPVALLAIVNFAAASLLIHRYYYSFEQVSDEDNQTGKPGYF